MPPTAPETARHEQQRETRARCMAMALRVSTCSSSSSIERRCAKQTALMHVCAVDEHSSNGTDGDRADKRNDVPFSFSFSPSPSSSCPSPRPRPSPSPSRRHRASPCACLRAALIPAPCPLALPPPPALSPAFAPRRAPVTDQRLTGSRSALVRRSFSTTRCRTGRDEAIHAQVRESAGPRSSRSCPACPPGPLCLGRLSYWVYDVAVQTRDAGQATAAWGACSGSRPEPEHGRASRRPVRSAGAWPGLMDRGPGRWCDRAVTDASCRPGPGCGIRTSSEQIAPHRCSGGEEKALGALRVRSVQQDAGDLGLVKVVADGDHCRPPKALQVDTVARRDGLVDVPVQGRQRLDALDGLAPPSERG